MDTGTTQSATVNSNRRFPRFDQQIRTGFNNAAHGAKVYGTKAVDKLQSTGGTAWRSASNVPSALSGAFNATRANLSTERSTTNTFVRNACLAGAAIGTTGAAALIFANLPIAIAGGLLLHDFFILGALGSLAGVAINELLHLLGIGRSTVRAAQAPEAQAELHEAKNEASDAAHHVGAAAEGAAHDAGHVAHEAAQGVADEANQGAQNVADEAHHAAHEAAESARKAA